MKKILLFLAFLLATTETTYETIEIRKAIPFKVDKYNTIKIRQSMQQKFPQYLETNRSKFKIPEISYEPQNKKFKISVGVAEGWMKYEGYSAPNGVQIKIEW